jgi:hypothetical protein
MQQPVCALLQFFLRVPRARIYAERRRRCTHAEKRTPSGSELLTSGVAAGDGWVSLMHAMVKKDGMHRGVFLMERLVPGAS